jgi:hypothetical protein
MRSLRIGFGALGLAVVLGGCDPASDDRAFKEGGDTPRASPAGIPTRDAPPDSTTGVARSSGRPGVAGDTVSRSSDISAPPGKVPAPEPKRP